MAGSDPVFAVGVYARAGMEHLGSNTDLCKTGVQFLVYGYRRTSPVGSSWLLPMAVVYVAHG